MRGSKSSRLRRPRLVIGAVAGVTLVLFGVCASRRPAGGNMVPTTGVLQGDLQIDVTSIGELQAVRSLTFGVPRLKASNAKIVWLVAEGTPVVAGDTLARFDTTEILRRVEDLESRLTSARANLEKLRAAQGARLAEMQANLEDQHASVRMAELAVENVSYESRVEQEKAALQLQRARLNLRQAESKLEAQRTIDAAEQTEQSVTITGLQSTLASEREALANHVIVAPTDGLVVYGTNWMGNRTSKIKVGDQLYYGGVVLELPDMRQMRVLSYVNEARVNLLADSLRCEVRVDALPDSVFRGKISRINVLGRELQEAEGVKVFDYEVLLERTDPRLRPGMTAVVRVHVEKLANVTYAPIETVQSDDAGLFVMRKRGRGFERVPVEIGRQNDFHVALLSGVKSGDELALRMPEPEE